MTSPPLSASPLPVHAPSLGRRARLRVEAWGFSTAAALLRAMGPDEASAFSGAVWRRLAPLNARHARARAQMRAAMPELSAEQIDAHLADMWTNLGRTSAEAFHIATLVRQRERFIVEDSAIAAVNQLKSRGAVLVSPHLGNWEIAIPFLNQLGLPMAGVYQRMQNPHVEAYGYALRAPHYQLGLFAKGIESARLLTRVVGNAGSVGLLADQRDVTGISVPFFHQPAPSTTFPALLARGRQIPLFAGAMFRTKGAHFHMKLVEIPVARTSDRETDLYETTAAIHACFERFIREAPWQWMWAHRRWAR